MLVPLIVLYASLGSSNLRVQRVCIQLKPVEKYFPVVPFGKAFDFLDESLFTVSAKRLVSEGW